MGGDRGARGLKKQCKKQAGDMQLSKRALAYHAQGVGFHPQHCRGEKRKRERKIE